MDEQAKLQYRIAQLEAQVDRAKREKAHLQSPHREPFARQRGGRWAPYVQPHRNLSLVTTKSKPAIAQPSLSVSGLNMVKPTGKSHQLVNESTLKREQDQQKEVKRRMQAKKEHGINQDTTSTQTPSSQVQSARRLELDGIHYRVSDDGSKLTREHDDGNNKETPKKVIVAGVTFLRTKHGNLLRAASNAQAASVTKPKPQCEHFTKDGTKQILISLTGLTSAKTSSCRLRNAGKCPWGHNCRFSHDPEKVAICKEFLRTGHCAQGSNCDLSHQLSYHRVSACTHFLRGNCTNDACRYPHVSVSPTAPVCRAFATLGYCNKGPKCEKRHVVECPDFANTGHCANHEHGKCKLPHVERANTLRKAARRQAKKGFEDESDLSSDEELDSPSDAKEDSDVIESDIEGMFDDLLASGSAGVGQQNPPHAFAEQQDYVRLS